MDLAGPFFSVGPCEIGLILIIILTTIFGKLHPQGVALSQTTWVTKMVITRVPGGPPGSILDQNDPTMSPDVPACPKGVKIN